MFSTVHTTCSRQPAADNLWHKTCSTQPAADNLQHTTCNTQPVTHNLQHKNCDTQPAAHNLQQTTCSRQPATHNLRLTTCNTQPATHNLRHTTCDTQPATHTTWSDGENPSLDSLDFQTSHRKLRQINNIRKDRRGKHTFTVVKPPNPSTWTCLLHWISELSLSSCCFCISGTRPCHIGHRRWLTCMQG